MAKSHEESEEKFDADTVLQDFIDRSKNLMEDYYERAFVRDKLSGLDSKEIILILKETPTNTKNYLRKLLVRLDHHGVRLNPETNDVDYSLVENNP